jgi:hypothetical protein
MLESAQCLPATRRWITVLRALLLCAWWHDGERAIAHAGDKRRRAEVS